jgi:hypothetical protein
MKGELLPTSGATAKGGLCKGKVAVKPWTRLFQCPVDKFAHRALGAGVRPHPAAAFSHDAAGLRKTGKLLTGVSICLPSHAVEGKKNVANHRLARFSDGEGWVERGHQ